MFPIVFLWKRLVKVIIWINSKSIFLSTGRRSKTSLSLYLWLSEQNDWMASDFLLQAMPFVSDTLGEHKTCVPLQAIGIFVKSSPINCEEFPRHSPATVPKPYHPRHCRTWAVQLEKASSGYPLFLYLSTSLSAPGQIFIVAIAKTSWRVTFTSPSSLRVKLVPCFV